jgi:hypothetical protein
VFEGIDLEAAHDHSFWNRHEVLRSETCGCFSCLAVFSPLEIDDWCDDVAGVGNTALCPRCGIDSVIGSASGLPLDLYFLRLMQEHFFTIPTRKGQPSN